MLNLHLIFLPMALGALAVLTLCLYKGEICPGQRGRLHRWLPVIIVPIVVAAGSVWLALSSLLLVVLTLIPAILIGVFCSKVKVGKTRDEGPRRLLQVAMGSGVVAWLATLMITGGHLWALSVASFVVPGLSFAQALLLKARSRLQSFHRILPVAGVIGTMVMLVALLAEWSALANVDAHQTVIFATLAGLVAACLTWVSHLFRSNAATLSQLVVVNGAILVSLLAQLPLLS
uniref:hypothetical protein n=1 Tax=Thaumasiovibrio occultus TaxID=1891184 RepID=UPI000B35685C|nr:hypothetical protein [Thaumasiovibrio occultus]